MDQNKNTAVTVGIPTYNQAAYIKETIGGCLKQTYPSLQIIVADDRSTDSTASIIRSFNDERIEYKLNDTNMGRVANYRHILYNYATTGWYVNLDGDDYFTDLDFIAHAMEMISRYPADDIAFYQANHDMEKLKKALPRFEILSDEEIITDGKDYFLNFPRIRKFTHCATVYNRKKAMETDFYNFDCLFTDFQSVSRLSLTGKVILSSRKVAVWRQHGFNESKSLNEQNFKKELASLEAIARFASPLLDKTNINNWLRQMKDYYRMVFIYHNSTNAPGWKTLQFIFRHWRFNWLFPQYVLKNLIRMLGKKGEHKNDQVAEFST